MKVAVVGAVGFVGSAISNAIKSSCKHQLISVVRGDDLVEKFERADAIIHAANPAKRFIAESDPHHDFFETAEKTFRIFSKAKNKKIVMISSLSCKTQLHTNYGRNRRFCELLALKQNCVVIRLGPMFGGNRKQDVLHDLLRDKPIYVSPETRYAYANIDWVGGKILEFLDVPSDVYEIGACNSVSLAELRDYFNSKSTFTGPNDTQIPEIIGSGPDAMLVVEYAKNELLNIDSWK